MKKPAPNVGSLLRAAFKTAGIPPVDIEETLLLLDTINPGWQRPLQPAEQQLLPLLEAGDTALASAVLRVIAHSAAAITDPHKVAEELAKLHRRREGLS